MFRVRQKITMIDPRPWQDEANGEVYLEFGVVYTIRDVELGIDGSGDTSLTFYEIRNERYRYLDDYGEPASFAGYFRPVVDMSDLEAIVTEVKRGKPRKIKADKFDRQPIHSSFSAASSPLSMQRDGASSVSRARPAGEALVSLASPAHSSRAAAASWPQRLPATSDMDAANSPRSRGLKMAPTAALLQEKFKTARSGCCQPGNVFVNGLSELKYLRVRM